MNENTGLSPRTELVEELMYGRPDRAAATELVQRFEDSLIPGEGKPSRFSATPEDIHGWLVKNFAEDRVLAYQRAVGGLAVHEATEEIREKYISDRRGRANAYYVALEVADGIDPEKGAGHFPSSLVHISRIECNIEDHNHTGKPDDIRRVTCRIQTPA